MPPTYQHGKGVNGMAEGNPNGTPYDEEKYLEDDFADDPEPSPMLEPWRIEGACVDLCVQLMRELEVVNKLVNRLHALFY